ncbi:class I glutamine amidotransferase-like protein [Punctularia strigosozonata HHB-11173 SS5]|uniref:Class I glutamine amidotransferase-like protein n=1 Tax=Punctularia strigosozonata (strain HHB-11173) TaxID=741275 RepID=R7S536_PUNST|nr:class I glutamine amidotransferase-like protein [Punctularia strigosozonata HHB-11173 SS5]EIN04967.1 class I glutamine amidotransferase-like protein [Punctularia strigosozonata HHB-11173 SS5]
MSTPERPLDFLGFVETLSQSGGAPHTPKYVFDIDVLSKSLEPVKPFGAGPRVSPTSTYGAALGSDGKQYDIIVIPAGSSWIGAQEQEAVDFITKQGAKAKYVLSVCLGSGILAASGLLDGKRATSNKMFFKEVAGVFPKVNWVPKARWVVDGKFWTGSGVTAGFDMAYAFASELLGKEWADKLAAFIEYKPATDPEDDEFAAVYGLV